MVKPFLQHLSVQHMRFLELFAYAPKALRLPRISNPKSWYCRHLESDTQVQEQESVISVIWLSVVHTLMR